MSGGKPWSQRGTKGGGEHIAVQERPSLVSLNLDQTTSLASGGVEKVEVYAPSGSVYRLTNTRIVIPADGTWTTGDHTLQFRSVGGRQVLHGRSDYATKIQFQFAEWVSANVQKWPTTAAAQQQVLSSVSADENNALVLQYHNDADAAQDNAREIELILDEVSY